MLSTTCHAEFFPAFSILFFYVALMTLDFFFLQNFKLFFFYDTYFAKLSQISTVCSTEYVSHMQCPLAVCDS